MRHIFAVMENKVTLQTILKRLLSLAGPIVIGQLGVVFVSFADTFMVGHYGVEELAAASFVNNLTMILVVTGLGFSLGLTPLVSEAEGKADRRRAGALLRNGLKSNGILSAIVFAVMLILYFNLGNMGQPEELLPLIRPYFIVVSASILCTYIFNAFKQFTDGLTRTKVSMVVIITSNVMNIIGNYVLIYGKAGFPEMGLLGYADRPANGHGDGFILTDSHLCRYARNHGTGRPPGNGYNFTDMLHALHSPCKRIGHNDKQLQRKENAQGSGPYRPCGIHFNIGNDGNLRRKRNRFPETAHIPVYRIACRSGDGRHPCPAFPALPVRGRASNRIRQCAQGTTASKADTANRLRIILHNIDSGKLCVCLPTRHGIAGNMVRIPGIAHLRRDILLPDIQENIYENYPKRSKGTRK